MKELRKQLIYLNTDNNGFALFDYYILQIFNSWRNYYCIHIAEEIFCLQLFKI